MAVNTRRQLRQLSNQIDNLYATDANALSVSRKELRANIKVRGHDDSSVIERLAHAVVAARDTLILTAHQGQRAAALALLQERFVEMPTGEGKTLAVALASVVAALDGTPVHVITANDYLAARDAGHLGPFYEAMGLTATCVLPSMDDDARRAAYACDIVHVTGKQVAFDWLRDQLNSGNGGRRNNLAARLGSLTRRSAQSLTAPPMLRGLCFAIVDEADSLLIDDARTPVVLAVERARPKGAGADLVVALGLGAIT